MIVRMFAEMSDIDSESNIIYCSNRKERLDRPIPIMVDSEDLIFSRYDTIEDTMTYEISYDDIHGIY